MPAQGTPPEPEPSEVDHIREEQPTPVLLWRVRGFRLTVETIALVAAVVVAAVAVAGAREEAAASGSPTEAETAVHEFFAAIQQGDVVGALYIAGVNRAPDGEEAIFLQPDAVSDEWELRSVRELQFRNTLRPSRILADDHATVAVTIAGPDGDTATTEMSLRRTVAAPGESPGPGVHGRWRFSEPLVWVRFAPSPLWYLEVNGVRAPAGPGIEEQAYALLPGFYRFHSEPPAGIEARFSSHHPLYPPDPEATGALLLPRTYLLPIVAEQVSLDAEVEEMVVREVHDYIDQCTERTELMPEGCPFGAEYSYHPTSLRDVIYWDRNGRAEWSIVEYPELAVVPGPEGIFITDRARGVVRLRANTDDGVPAEVECEMIMSRFEAGVLADGSVVVGPTRDVGESWYWHRRRGDPEAAGIDPATRTIDTCHRPHPAN